MEGCLGRLGVSELRALRQLRDENSRLKRLAADLSLDKHILQEVLFKKSRKTAARRSLVVWVRLSFGYNERQACGLMGSFPDLE